MEEFLKIVEELFNNKAIQSIIVVILCYLLYKIITYILNTKYKKFRILNSGRGKTYVKMINSIIRYIFILIALIIILKVNGINITSMLAGVGIASVIIGFAIQDLLKDIIKGLDILTDQYFEVGDVIKYQDFEGKVISIGLRCTKVENVRTYNIVSISNRNIEQVEVVSNMINIDIPFPYELKVKKVEDVIDDILSEINKIKGVDKSEYRGIQTLDDSSINYNIKVYCKPILKVQMTRDVLRCIMLNLESHNINVPYKQIDIHQK